MQKICVVDSHTGGEPTRIIVEGGPDLGNGTLSSRVEIFRNQFDEIRSAVVNEPRGSDVVVGGLLCEPCDSSCCAGIIFFNTSDYLGMCGHGTIGLMVTLKHLGRIEDGVHRIETPVGVVIAELDGANVSVQNVPSFRYKKNVELEVPGYGLVVGDIAWGGNWFFCVTRSPDENLEVSNVNHLTQVALKIQGALSDQNITGSQGAFIDHIELYGPAQSSQNDSRNFVLCPSGAYDRSPCGTGTSAKIACLAADGKLSAGEIWRQESIVGSLLEGSYQWGDEIRQDTERQSAESDRQIIPTIRGAAYLMAESTLLFDADDPFRFGITK